MTPRVTPERVMGGPPQDWGLRALAGAGPWATALDPERGEHDRPLLRGEPPQPAPGLVGVGVEQVSRQAGEVAQGLAQGRWVAGDPTVNENYIVFGDPIYAVGPGRVVSILTDLPENTPPTPPPASNPQTILGNHIIQDLGGGRFALYAHMQPNSIPAGIHLGSRLQWAR